MKSLLKRILKVYSAFALINILYKLLYPYYCRVRARYLWKHLKGSDADPFARKLRSYGKSFHDFLAEPGLKYPNEDICKIPVPGPALSFNTPRAIKWLLKDEFHNVTKPGRRLEMWNLLSDFLGSDGIFVLRHGNNHKEENEAWLKQRKVASLIFTKNNFMTVFYDTFVDKGERLVKLLKEKDGEVVDLQSLFFSFTMDSIEKFFMGTDVNTIEGGMSEYAKNFDEAHSCMMKIMTEQRIPMLLSRLLLPFPFGTLGFSEPTSKCLVLQMIYFFNPSYNSFRKSVKSLDDHVYKYIKQTRIDPKLKQRKDVIANFLNSKIGSEITDKTLRDIVLNLTIAGRDTTACALSWLFFQLTQNEGVQDKLITEIDSVLKGSVPTLSQLEPSEMPYLNGCIYETLRLHPPVPTESKVIEKETTYLDGTVIPARTGGIFSPRAIGRNPTKYPEPLTFKPERWIPFVQPSLYEFPVFQAGPRFCLGKDMAQFEMKLVTVMLLQHLKFKLKEGEEKKVGYSLMLTQSISTDANREIMELLCIPRVRK